MSEPHEDHANANDASTIGPSGRASQVRERARDSEHFTSEAEGLPALVALLRLGPDAVIDQLVEGRPRNFAAECEEHAKDNAYFIEEGRVAARVIASLASSASGYAAAYPPADDLAEQLETIVEEATATVLEEGALGGDVAAEPDPIVRRIGLVLGTDARFARSMIDTLNSFEFTDRHVLFHCIVEGLSPEEYARKFNDDARVVAAMLRSVAKLAVDDSAG